LGSPYTRDVGELPNMCVERVSEWLERHGLKWRLIRAATSTRTVRDAAGFLGVDVSSIVKTLIIYANNAYYAVILPGNRRLDFEKLNGIIGGNPRLAKPSEVLSATGFPAGGVPPVALPENIRIIVDQEVLEKEVVYGGGGGENYLLEFKPREYVELLHPVVADVSKD